MADFFFRFFMYSYTWPISQFNSEVKTFQRGFFLFLNWFKSNSKSEFSRMNTCETKPQLIFRLLDFRPPNPSPSGSSPQDLLQYEPLQKSSPNVLLISNRENAFKTRFFSLLIKQIFWEKASSVSRFSGRTQGTERYSKSWLIPKARS